MIVVEEGFDGLAFDCLDIFGSWCPWRVRSQKLVLLLLLLPLLLLLFPYDCGCMTSGMCCVAVTVTSSCSCSRCIDFRMRYLSLQSLVCNPLRPKVIQVIQVMQVIQGMQVIQVIQVIQVMQVFTSRTTSCSCTTHLRFCFSFCSAMENCAASSCLVLMIKPYNNQNKAIIH